MHKASGGTGCATCTTARRGRRRRLTRCNWLRARRLFTFKLVSEVTGRLPFTIGQPFKRGDVPSGVGIVADCAEFQADIRNRWEDGSVKFAVLSGLADMTAGAAQPVTVAVGGAEQATGLTESALLTALGANDVTVKFSNVRDNKGVVLLADATCSLKACVGQDGGVRPGAGAAHSGLVRAFTGPVMSEFHYYCKTGEAQLAVWFYVRLYRDKRIEVEIVVENGWLYAPTPGDRRYGVTHHGGRCSGLHARIQGSDRQGAAAAVPSHALAARVLDWRGSKNHAAARRRVHPEYRAGAELRQGRHLALARSPATSKTISRLLAC